MICARSHVPVSVLLQMSGLSFPASEPYNPRLSIVTHHKRTVESNLFMFVVFQSCLRFHNLVVFVNFLTVQVLYVESLTLLSGGSRISQGKGLQPKRKGGNLLFGNSLADNCMKMEENWTGKGSLTPLSFVSSMLLSTSQRFGKLFSNL